MISLIGMGSGCPESLTAQGLAALQGAGLILGAKRLLEHLPAGCTDNCKAVYKPEDILACLAAQPDTDTAILYSGDTGFYSGAAKLLPLLRAMGYSVRVLPGLSSVQLLAAAVGRPWQDWKLVSAHGRACDPVAEVLAHPQVFFLTGGGDTPATLCAKLTAAGLGAAHALVGENLGTPAEAIRFGLARELAAQSFAPLSVLLIEREALPPRRTLRARFETWDQVPEQALSGVEYLILPIAQADRVPREWRGKTLLELPRVMFGALEEDTARRIAATQDAGFAGYEVSNIAHLRLCRGLPMTGGFGLNVTNQMAAQFYADHGLNSVLILPEVKDSDISTIAPTHNGKPVPTGVLVYGHMPLMVTRACPLQNIHDCAHCNKAGELTDRKAKKFPVRCGMGVRTIYNPVPIYMGDKPGALTVDYGVAYFTLESREEAAAILDSIRVHAPFEGEFTRGLYFKGTN